MSLKVILHCLFPYHTLEIIINYISIESLKSQNSSFENHFKTRHCLTMEMVHQNHITKYFRL